jgi:hypothetical protein
MDELVEQIAAKTGLGSAVVRKAVGIIINFLGREGPPEKVQAIIDKLAGARALGDENAGASGGLLGVFNDLTAAGLGMAQVQVVAREFVTFAKVKAGEAEVNAVINAIPGLTQFI